MLEKIKNLIIRFKKWIAGLLLLLGGKYILTASLVTPSISLEEQIIKDIEISQDNYFQKNGKYWQGLPTHTSIPDATTTPDNLSVKPYYQAEGWNDLVSLSNELPFQIEVHQYKAPGNNYGYQIFLRSDKGTKSIGYGKEAQSRTWEIDKKWVNTTSTK